MSQAMQTRGDRYWVNKRSEKKRTSRLVRRAVRLDPETAPTKLRHVIFGYST